LKNVEASGGLSFCPVAAGPSECVRVLAPLSAGLAPVANQYAWCSAAWFESNARSGFVKSVYLFKTDWIKVSDDF
jgi:hypothetical protein